MMPNSCRIFLLLSTFVALAMSGAAFAGPSGVDDVKALFDLAPTRAMGSPDHERVQEYVAERFRATGHEHGEMAFPTVAFRPGRARLRLQSGQSFDLYAMAPNSAHPGNLPLGAWNGELIDAGEGAGVT